MVLEIVKKKIRAKVDRKRQNRGTKGHTRDLQEVLNFPLGRTNVMLLTIYHYVTATDRRASTITRAYNNTSESLGKGYIYIDILTRGSQALTVT